MVFLSDRSKFIKKLKFSEDTYKARLIFYQFAINLYV
jgi:hypothetical protein